MKLTATLLLFAAVIIGSILHSSIEKALTPPPGNNDFILGAMSNFMDPDYGHISNPDEFGMNLWHRIFTF